MKNGKKILALLLAALLILTGCSRGTSKTPSVWLIVKSTETEFWQAAFAGANAAKTEYNLDLSIYGPDTEEDYETQNMYIDRAIREKADAIVLSAISYNGNADAVARAIAAGIKVVVIDSDVDCPGVSARIGTDNEQAGRMACQVILDAGEQDLFVGIINFDAGVRNGQERENGFRELLYQDPRVRQIFTIHVLTSEDEAKAQTEALLAQHPEINALVSFNEPLTVGAARAVQAMCAQDHVNLVGFDTNVSCIDMMQEGILSALMVQNPYAMGYLGVETAWKILNGETVDPDELIQTPAVVVKRDNMFTTESQKVLFPFG